MTTADFNLPLPPAALCAGEAAHARERERGEAQARYIAALQEENKLLKQQEQQLRSQLESSADAAAVRQLCTTTASIRRGKWLM